MFIDYLDVEKLVSLNEKLVSLGERPLRKKHFVNEDITVENDSVLNDKNRQKYVSAPFPMLLVVVLAQ